jgi:hypothetical protein
MGHKMTGRKDPQKRWLGMSSRANPEDVGIIDRSMATQAGVSSFIMDSETDFRDTQCKVIETNDGQAAASSGVWVLEVGLCDA